MARVGNIFTLANFNTGNTLKFTESGKPYIRHTLSPTCLFLFDKGDLLLKIKMHKIYLYINIYIYISCMIIALQELKPLNLSSIP